MLLGVELLGDQVFFGRTVQKYPIGLWDNTKDKLHPKSSDIRLTIAKEALWIDCRSTIQDVREAIRRKTSSRPGGGFDFCIDRRIGDSLESTSPNQVEFSWTAQMSRYTKCGNARQALRIYEELRQRGMKLSSYTFVAALKACSDLEDLESAKQIHAEVIKCGSESHLFVANALVNVYAECGSLLDSRLVFENMRKRDVVSWNSIISGYAQAGHGDVALQLYMRMKQEGVALGDRTFVAALKACGSLVALEVGNSGGAMHAGNWCLEQVRTVHADVLKSGLESALYVGTMLVDVFAKCGSLVEARCVFEKMPYRNVVSWTAMIFGYAQMEEAQEALQLYARMQQEGVVPNERTFVAALKACNSLAGQEEGSDMFVKQQSLQQVRLLHSDIVKNGSESDIFVGTQLVNVYAKCGSLLDARFVFEKLPHPDVVSWNVMILGYAQMEDGKEALQLYQRMQEKRVVPDTQTFAAALKACCSLAKVDGGPNVFDTNPVIEQVRAIHSDIRKAGCESDVCIGTTLVDAYAKCGSLVDARWVFENMPQRDVVSWNAMILGYVMQEEPEEALQLYASMRRDHVKPNDQTFLTTLKACSSLCAVDDEIRSDGGFGGKQCYLRHIRAIHADIVESGSESDVFVGTMLVDGYAKCGDLVEARHVFEQLAHRDVVSWTAMILGYTQIKQGELALQFYEAMQQEGVVPDAQAFVCALKACGSIAALEMGRKIHEDIVKTDTGTADLFVASSLIDMYGKCGSMVDARQIFDALPTRDTVTWSALIARYACQGDRDIVFDLFDRMREEDIQPDGITFLSLLTVCSHSGLVAKGQEYFESMTTAYGITPTANHYACMVDLLGRAGQLDKALVMANACKSSGVVWRCLLGACQKWSNVELGRHAFECALLLDTSDDAAYVLMSNIYAAANMLEDAKEIQRLRVMTCAWKKPGQSWWTDGGRVMHAFRMGDQAHPQSHEIYAKLQDLFVKLEKEAPFQLHQ